MGTMGCRIGVAPHMYVGAFGEDAADALSNAGAAAAKVKELLDAHPEAAAALSLVPGGAAAFGAISAAAKLYKSGLSAKDIEKRVGPTATKLVHSIMSIF